MPRRSSVSRLSAHQWAAVTSRRRCALSVITAISLGAGLKAAGALTDNAQRLAEVTAAHWCADNLLTELRLGKQFPGTGESEFACSQLGRDYRGLLRTQATPNPNFRRVEALVMDDAGHVVATLATVMGRY